MFIALASVQQRRTKEDKRCHKITEKGYLKTKDNKTTDIYIQFSKTVYATNDGKTGRLRQRGDN